MAPDADSPPDVRVSARPHAVPVSVAGLKFVEVPEVENIEISDVVRIRASPRMPCRQN